MDRQHNGQRKKDKRINNALQNITQKKLKIEPHEPCKIPGMNTGALEGLAVPAPSETPVVLNDTNII